MKYHKFADKKKELIAIILICLIVAFVSFYVIYLVHGLTKKMYQVFGQSADKTGGFTHFNFEKFEELGLRPKRATSTPAAVPPPVAPITPSATTTGATSTGQATGSPQATTTTSSSSAQ